MDTFIIVNLEPPSKTPNATYPYTVVYATKPSPHNLACVESACGDQPWAESETESPSFWGWEDEPLHFDPKLIPKDRLHAQWLTHVSDVLQECEFAGVTECIIVEKSNSDVGKTVLRYVVRDVQMLLAELTCRPPQSYVRSLMDIQSDFPSAVRILHRGEEAPLELDLKLKYV